MNTNILTALFLIPSFICGALPAVANAAPVGVARGGERTVVSERAEKTPVPRPIDIELVWHHRDPSYNSLGIFVNDEMYVV